MNITYELERNLIYSLNNEEAIVQNQIGITKVTDPKLVELLLSCENRGLVKLSKDEIAYTMGDDTEEAIEFMMAQGMLKKYKEKKQTITELLVYSTDSKVAELLYSTLNSFYEDKLTVKSLTDLAEIEAHPNSIIISFLNPYRLKDIENLVRFQKEADNTVFLNTYIYNKFFYIDCMYSRDWVVPCHNCHMGHIKMAGYLGDSSAISYQGMIELLYAENDEFQLQYPINEVQRLNICTSIVNSIHKQFYDLQSTLIHFQDISISQRMDLIDFKRFEDTSLFWEMCDCYE